MRGRKLLGAAVGLVGTAAVGNRVIANRTEPLGPPLARETGTYRWRGMELSYTEGGDPEDPDVLLVHSLHRAGTSREFSRIYERLTESYHVFAPDLPGFGRSDRPPMRYSGTLFETFLEDFVDDLTDRPIVLGSGLGGTFAAAAAQHVDTGRLLLVCPSEAYTRSSTIGATLLGVPVLGTAGFNLLTSRRGLQQFAGTQLLYDPASLSDEDLGYLWNTAHQEHAEYPIASALRGHLEPSIDPGAALATLDVGSCLIWGRDAARPGLREGRHMADRADVKLVVMDQTRRLPHFEQPGAFLDILAEELPTAR